MTHYNVSRSGDQLSRITGARAQFNQAVKDALGDVG